MGHFTINLPNNQHGEVRWGTMRKKSILLSLLKRNKSGTEIKKGYIIMVGSNSNEHKEYRLLKTHEGKWTSENDGGFQVTPDDEITASIKNAIDSYENRH